MGRLRTIALRSLGAGAALGLAVVLNFTPGTATPAKAQPAPSTSGLYCAPGLVYVGGFCVRDLGFVPTPDLCPPGFGPVSFGRLAGCGGASSAAFASQALSGIVRTTSQEA